MDDKKMGRPLKFNSVEELQVGIDAYFKDCKENNRPLTITGLAVALKCDRETLLNYEKKEEFFGTIKEAKNKIHNYAEEYLYSGKQVAGAIFNLKNNYGWKDKTEVEHQGDSQFKIVLGNEDISSMDSTQKPEESNSEQS